MLELSPVPPDSVPKRKLNAVDAFQINGDAVRVSRDYFAKTSEEMSVFLDDELELLDDSNDNWWLLKDSKSGQIGYVPSKIVRTMNEIEAISNSFQNMQVSSLKNSSTPSSNKSIKKVRFSSDSPIQHIFEPVELDEESYYESFKNLEEIESDEDPHDTFGFQSGFYENALIDEAVRKALGIDDAKKQASADIVHVSSARKEEAGGLSEFDVCSSAERLLLVDSEQKNSRIKGALHKLWSSKNVQKLDQVPVKVNSGNFIPIPQYKTGLISEQATLDEIEILAKKLFKIQSNEDFYSLSVVHKKSRHILDLNSKFSLSTVQELIKIATIEDGYMLDEKGKPYGRHKKKVPKKYLSILKQRKQSVNLQGIKAGFVDDFGVKRHHSSDFPSSYEFVLNLQVAPYVQGQFYIWVELESTDKEEQEESRIALAVKPLTTVEEVINRSINAMDIGKLPGVTYDLVMSLAPSFLHEFKYDPNDGREVLTRELTITDIQNQWPHIDPSGFLFILRSFVILDHSSSNT